MRNVRASAFLVVLLVLVATACSSPAGPDEAADAGDESQSSSTEGSQAASAALDDRARSHLVAEGETTWDVQLQDDAAVVPGDALTAVDGDRDRASARYLQLRVDQLESEFEAWEAERVEEERDLARRAEASADLVRTMLAVALIVFGLIAILSWS